MKTSRPEKEEFIGLDFEVISSKNKSGEGISGKVLNETHHTFEIFSNGKIKRLLKKNITFKVHKGNAWHAVSGNNIDYRPEDRIKKIK